MSVSPFDFNTSLNQAPPLEDYNPYTTHPALQQAVNAYGGERFHEQATAFGAVMGSADMIAAGHLANKNGPVLKTHDRFGNRLDVVEFHPAYHDIMRIAVQHQVHAISWTAPRNGGYLAHSILAFLKQQVDEGTSCPLTMTFAAVPSLKLDTDLAEEWLPLLLSNTYDERHLPYYDKKGITIGMAMTEPQGGSDVRSNLTFAIPTGNGIYAITGRKWFCSAPMSDAFLVLAQTAKGPGCFLVPRFRPDGVKNNLYFQRLKDKLGNKSNASGEVAFQEAWGKPIGEEGRGIAAIMEMVRHTRLDCAIGSAATLQRALTEVIHHCHHRSVFGKKLIDQDLMRNVLADLCLESEAATTLAMRLAKGFDDALTDESALHFIRIATAAGKFWNTKRAVLALGEVMECMGGNGYVEESILPRLYRDIPVNAIWEGSGNVQALDVLRAMQKEPQSMDALMQYFQQAKGMDKALDIQLGQLQHMLTDNTDLAFKARIITEKIALCMQAAELIRIAPPTVAEMFCRARLSEERHLTWGTLETARDAEEIIARVYSVS